MKLAACTLVIGLGLFALILMSRIDSGRSWSESLKSYRLHLPAGLTPDDVARWLGMMAASTVTTQWNTRPPSVFGLEVRASAYAGIRHYLLVPEYAEVAMLQGVRTGLPGIRLAEATDDETPAPLREARELRLTNNHRLLAVERVEAVAAAFLGSLQPLASGQEVRAVWYLAGLGAPRQTPVADKSTWLGINNATNAEQYRAEAAKQEHPLLRVAIRIGAAASTSHQARELISRVIATFRGANAPGVQVVTSFASSAATARRMTQHILPRSSWMELNARELAGLIGLPVGGGFTPGLSLGTSRQLPPSPSSPRSGILLAHSTYPGVTQALRQRAEDRLRHTWLLGPTGTGKSTLIANMVLQDAAAGHGLVVVDPKSDLVEEIVSRLPQDRHDDLIVLDPTAYISDQAIVGLNVLGQARTEYEQELATDQIVHIMSSIWADSWGPRTSDVIRNALLTLASAKAMDGSAFTLIEGAELLINPSFRRFVTSQPSIPETVRPFWDQYESYSDAQKLQIVGPSLNKLRALSTRTPLRLMLGQSSGLEMDDVFKRGKILLAPLSKGTVGPETAALLGSLVVSSVVSAIFARSAIPAAERSKAFVYLDEFQDVLRLPLDLADGFAQARGLGAGFILANQYLGQLPESIKKACFGTVRSTILFQLDLDDARIFERRFAPLTASDLTHLPAYEIVARLCEHSAVAQPVTGLTLPLPEPTVDRIALVNSSSTRYGRTRKDVEAAIQARITRTKQATSETTHTPFGRRTLPSDVS